VLIETEKTEREIPMQTMESILARCSEQDGHLIWDGPVTKSGTPVVQHRSGHLTVARVMWELENEQIGGRSDRWIPICRVNGCVSMFHTAHIRPGESKEAREPWKRMRSGSYQSLGSLWHGLGARA
jgi:hypothetical protein